MASTRVLNAEGEMRLAALRNSLTEHRRVIISVVEAAGRDFYTLDFLVFGAINRSLCMTRGFCDAIESSNFLCAVPLIRMQLDNALRVAAAGWAEDGDALASGVLGGMKLSDFRDRDGRPLTDANLCRRFARTYPWVESVYRETSGFIHLSEKHIFNALQIRDKSERTISWLLSDKDEFVPASAYSEAVCVYSDVTRLFLGVVDGYARSKSQRFQGRAANDPEGL